MHRSGPAYKRGRKDADGPIPAEILRSLPRRAARLVSTANDVGTAASMATVSGASTYKHGRSDKYGWSYKRGRSYPSECQGTQLPGVPVRLSCLPLAPLREPVPSRFQPRIFGHPRRYKQKLKWPALKEQTQKSKSSSSETQIVISSLSSARDYALESVTFNLRVGRSGPAHGQRARLAGGFWH